MLRQVWESNRPKVRVGMWLARRQRKGRKITILTRLAIRIAIDQRPICRKTRVVESNFTVVNFVYLQCIWRRVSSRCRRKNEIVGWLIRKNNAWPLPIGCRCWSALR